MYRPFLHAQCAMALILTVTCAAGVLNAEPAATQPNQVLGPIINTNGGFEDGLSNYFRTRIPCTSIDSDEVYRGQNALRMQGEKQEQGDHNIVVTGGIPCEVGKHYVFKFAVKAKDVGAEAAFAPFAEIVGSTGVKGSDVSLARIAVESDTDWIVKQAEIVVPEGVKTLGYRLVTPRQSGATVWFDEVQIREIIQ